MNMCSLPLNFFLFFSFLLFVFVFVFVSVKGRGDALILFPIRQDEARQRREAVGSDQMSVFEETKTCRISSSCWL